MKIIITVPTGTKDDYFDKICEKFKEKYGEETVFEKILSDSLIGGFSADIDGTVYDTSIRSKLYAVKRTITK